MARDCHIAVVDLQKFCGLITAASVEVPALAFGEPTQSALQCWPGAFAFICRRVAQNAKTMFRHRCRYAVILEANDGSALVVPADVGSCGFPANQPREPTPPSRTCACCRCRRSTSSERQSRRYAGPNETVGHGGREGAYRAGGLRNHDNSTGSGANRSAFN
jgi:hypothetical protein